MKRLITALLVLLCFFGITAYAEDGGVYEKPQTPQLVSISFKNGTVNEKFSSEVYDYTLKLENPKISPTLKDFKIDGRADLFINYITDEANHQTGVSATLEYENGSTKYNFIYTNAATYEVNSNNQLLELRGTNVEVYPKINRRTTHYKLYIPSDMTVLRLTGVTRDVSAFCVIPYEIEIALDQEPEIPVTVTASNGKTRLYTFDVKRVDKTTAEVEYLMSQKDFKTLAEDEQFYRKPMFYIIVLSVALGLLFIILLFDLMRRISLKVGDDDETEFFE